MLCNVIILPPAPKTKTLTTKGNISTTDELPRYLWPWCLVHLLRSSREILRCQVQPLLVFLREWCRSDQSPSAKQRASKGKARASKDALTSQLGCRGATLAGVLWSRWSSRALSGSCWRVSRGPDVPLRRPTEPFGEVKRRRGGYSTVGGEWRVRDSFARGASLRTGNALCHARQIAQAHSLSRPWRMIRKVRFTVPSCSLSVLFRVTRSRVTCVAVRHIIASMSDVKHVERTVWLHAPAHAPANISSELFEELFGPVQSQHARKCTAAMAAGLMRGCEHHVLVMLITWSSPSVSWRTKTWPQWPTTSSESSSGYDDAEQNLRNELLQHCANYAMGPVLQNCFEE